VLDSLFVELLASFVLTKFDDINEFSFWSWLRGKIGDGDVSVFLSLNSFILKCEYL
jgi:hypothetical protein